MTKILRKLLQLQRAPTPSCSATLCSHHPCRGWGFPSFQSGPTLGGQWGPQATGAWQAHPCPPFSNGAAQSPPSLSQGHHPRCRTLGSARCQRGAKHPPVPSSCSSTSGALWGAGRSGNKKFMAKASQEAPSSCESATHRDPIEPQTAAASHSQHSHCSPASSPEQAASQQPGTHRNSPRTPLHPTAQEQFCCLLLQRAEHQHPDLGSGRGTQGQEQGQPQPGSPQSSLDSLSRWERLGCKAWAP